MTMRSILLLLLLVIVIPPASAATKNLVPNVTGDGGLGTAAKQWREVNAVTGAFSGKLTLNGVPVSTNANGVIDTNTLTAIVSSNLTRLSLRGTNAAGILGADGTGTNRLGLLWPENLVGNWNIIWPTTNALDGQTLLADVSGSNVFLYWSTSTGAGEVTQAALDATNSILLSAIDGRIAGVNGLSQGVLDIRGPLDGVFLHLGPQWQVNEDPGGWNFGWNDPHLLGTNLATGDWYQFDGQDPRSIATFEDVAAAVMDGTGKTLLVTPDIELDFDSAVTVDLAVTNAWNFHGFTAGNIDITVINPPAQRWFNIYIEGAAPIAESRAVTWTWPAGTVVRWADGVVADSVASNATLVVSGYWRTATNVVLTGKGFK